MNKQFTMQDAIDFLATRYKAAQTYQTGKGVQFNITFPEFVSLFSTYRKNLILSILNKSGPVALEKFFRNKQNGWVLSWISGKPQTEMNASNVKIMTRTASKKNSQFKKGDKHSEETKLHMSVQRTGVSKSEEHKKAISASKKGMQMTEEHKAKLREAAKRREARKRGELVDEAPAPVVVKAVVESLPAPTPSPTPVPAAPVAKRNSMSPLDVIAALKMKPARKSDPESIIDAIKAGPDFFDQKLMVRLMGLTG